MKIRDRLLKRFRSFRYRHAYVDEFTDAHIATQIKVLREQLKLTQDALADLAGMRQSQISELEDVNNRSWKVRTLKKIAKAFDLVLVVRFEEFGKILPDIGHLDREHLQRRPFKEDPVFLRNTDDKSVHTDMPAAAVASTTRTVGRVLNAHAKFGTEDIQNVA